jgi:hypothetical protein
VLPIVRGEKVELAGGELTHLMIAIREDGVTLEHENKFGLPYREAYR